jgi:hypothetical protein
MWSFPGVMGETRLTNNERLGRPLWPAAYLDLLKIDNIE